MLNWLANLFLKISLFFAVFEAGRLKKDAQYLSAKAKALQVANEERYKILTDSQHRDNVRKLFDDQG